MHCREVPFDPSIGSPGTFFTSTIIHCLLNPRPEFTDAYQFAQGMQESFLNLKDLYREILLNQVKIDEEDKKVLKEKHLETKLPSIIDESLNDYRDVEKFFEIDLRSEQTFLPQPDLLLPSFIELIVPKENWCFAKRKLPSFIFTNHKYYQYDTSISTHASNEQPKEDNKEEKIERDPEVSKYGPRPDECNTFIFKINFFDCLKEKLSEYGLSSKLKWGLQYPDHFKQETKSKFDLFRRQHIEKYRDPRNSRAIKHLYRALKYNLESTFTETKDQNTLFECVDEALNIVTEAWKGVFI